MLLCLQTSEEQLRTALGSDWEDEENAGLEIGVKQEPESSDAEKKEKNADAPARKIKKKKVKEKMKKKRRILSETSDSSPTDPKTTHLGVF